MGLAERTDQGRRLESSVLGQRPGNNLERLCKLSNSMLGQPGRLLAKLGDDPGELHLGRAGTGDESTVLDELADGVDPVVERAFEVVQLVGSRSPEDDRCRSRALVGLLAEDRHSVTTDLDRLKHVDETGLFGCRCAHSSERRGRADPAQTAEVKLGEDLEDGDALAVEVVEGEVADTRSGDDEPDARVGDLLEDL